jgi:hypothetical protein
MEGIRYELIGLYNKSNKVGPGIIYQSRVAYITVS